MTIRFFTGKHKFLSNFYPLPDGSTTLEHMFQSAKAETPEEKAKVMSASTPGQAKRAGRKVTLRADWEQVKDQVMLDLLRFKFSYPALRNGLLATGDQELIETNNWNDTYWGVSAKTGNGRNRLGLLLMQVRDEIRNTNPQPKEGTMSENANPTLNRITVDAEQYDDLKDVYLFTFESHTVTAGDITDHMDGVNNRYGRELVGTLVNAGLLVEIDNEDGMAYQTVETYDATSQEDALVHFDNKFESETQAKTAPTTPSRSSGGGKSSKVGDWFPHAAKEITDCLCGCGGEVGANSFYKPGHDARHAGMVGRAAAQAMAKGAENNMELFSELPSQKLVDKAENIAEKALAKLVGPTAKDEPEAGHENEDERVGIEGTATRGKTEVIARRLDTFEDGEAKSTYVYLDTDGNWSPLSKSAAKTFTQEG